MTPLSCQEAEPLLDLYAADACVAEQAEAISAHLADCPRCRATFAQARETLVLLDWTVREPAARQRLRDRIEEEARRLRQRPRGGVVPLWVRQVGSLAALLLLTVGLAGWLGRGGRVAVGPESLLASLTVAPEDLEVAPGLTRNHHLELAKARAQDVRKAKKVVQDAHATRTHRVGAGNTPPEVHLTLELTNSSDRPVLIRTDGPDTLIQIELEGPGVRQRALRDPAREAPLSPRSLVLQPGATGNITLHRLEAGRPGAWTGWSWTAPGDYTLTVRLRVEAVYPATARRTEQRGTLWLASPPVQIRVLP
jgi:hypothetical protein